MDQYIGKLLDNRYEILERIGTGGMAVVYKARCHRLNRLVAVKILKEELAQDADFRRRFHDESQAVAMLSHPNIMAVYDVSRSSEIDYIVMELIDGITLKQYMQKKGGKLSWRESLHFITQIMKALSHAHGRGIIHRDIKPHNIMVLRDGSVKVTDFGIARLTSAAQNTLTQEALGSVHYISPEQARGSHIDARSDIYSAGVVLYEMVTGRLPYEGDSPVSVAIQHINSIPLAPRELEADIPEALESITLKAMSSDVSQRYISADAMLVDLEEFRKNPNINFDFGPVDLIPNDVDEPTQVLGANTPSTVHVQPTHAPHRTQGEDSTLRRRNTGGRPVIRDTFLDPDDGYDDRPRRRQGGSAGPVIAAVGAIIVFIFVIGFFLYTAFIKGIINPPPALVAPDLYDLALDDAKALPYIVDNNITIIEGESAPSNTVSQGHIISQMPEAKSIMPASDMTITVTVSSGGEEVMMPDYFGKDARTAELELKGMGYDVEIITDNSEDVTEGCIMEQIPAANIKLTLGQKITLTKSLGRKVNKVTVPRFVGLSIDDAKQIAKNELNLKVEIDRDHSSEIIKDFVMQQSIASGNEVDEGTTILFVVSDGKDPEFLPTPTPSPEPMPSPTPSDPQEIPPVEVPVSKQITVNLPQDGRTTVSIQIKVGNNDNAFYNPQVETKLGKITPDISAPSGDHEVTIYIDNEVVQTSTERF